MVTPSTSTWGMPDLAHGCAGRSLWIRAVLGLQLGQGSQGSEVDIPSHVIRWHEKILKVQSGENHILVLLDSGRVVGLGASFTGQLCIPPTLEHQSRRLSINLHGVEQNIVDIAAAGVSSVFVTNDGRLLGCGAASIAWGKEMKAPALSPLDITPRPELFFGG